MTALQISPKLSRGKQPFIVLYGSGIRTVHSRDSLALLHDVWVLRWKNQKLGARITCRLIHPHVWWLMLTVGWVLSCECQLEPLYDVFLTKWWLDFKGEIPRGSQWKLFYTLALEITQYHFYGTIFMQEVSFREREYRLHLLKEEYQHHIEGRTCRNEYVLVYPSLKNTTCYRH